MIYFWVVLLNFMKIYVHAVIIFITNLFWLVANHWCCNDFVNESSNTFIGLWYLLITPDYKLRLADIISKCPILHSAWPCYCLFEQNLEHNVPNFAQIGSHMAMHCALTDQDFIFHIPYSALTQWPSIQYLLQYTVMTVCWSVSGIDFRWGNIYSQEVLHATGDGNINLLNCGWGKGGSLFCNDIP